jgi:ribonuclease BN (tRNA processing enzyme)
VTPVATQIVMLGTGTPYPDPDRSGPATAIIVDSTPYLIDFGPGVIRRVAAAWRKGVTAFGPSGVNITTAFLTHLHSDHTVGYPDLILTPWTMGRAGPLTVYGPPGLKAMTEHVLAAWRIDIEARARRLAHSDAWRVIANELGPGVVFRDRNVVVTAFPVHHHEIEPSFGFRFETDDRTIVISGDTTPTPALIEHARGCDVLIHEAYSMASYAKISPTWQQFRRTHHTSSQELAAIAGEVKPALLVLYHRSNAGGVETETKDDEQELADEVRRSYGGTVVAARDLDVL